MQRARFLLASSGLIIAGAAIWASGCSTFREDCENGVCAPYKPSESSSSSSGGDGGVIEPSCSGDPSETDPRTMGLKAFDPDCSVFAWAGATNPAPDGTMANPFPSLETAIVDVSNPGKDQGKWIIACNKDDFLENVTTPNSAQIYGGFDCTTLAKWALDPTMKKSSLVGKDPSAAALTMKGDGSSVSVQVKDFTITSPSATAKGSSSVAVAIDDITAALLNCDVKAGDGGDGEDGVAPSGTVVDGASAPMPNAVAMNACINPAALSSGPAATPTACDDGMSIAGNGGKGGDNGDGQPGADGQPADMTQGKGGSADTGAGCTDGSKGKDGNPGADGEPGPASSSPEAATLTGITGGDGGDGKSGGRGQGGGGGGGRKSGSFCPPAGNAPGNGASGGGGGAGGCGGKGGGGGKAGGSSIGIISLGTKLTLTDVTLTVGKGGKGGNGGTTQGRGAGGSGSAGGAASGFGASKPGCIGGKGGDGGAGGVGGGGRGGHSFGILYAATPNAAPTLKSYTPGTAGLGGSAGLGGPMSSNGAAGLSRQCWDFSKKASCM